MENSEIIKIEKILKEVITAKSWEKEGLRKILARHPKEGGGFFGKDQLVGGYRELVRQGKIKEDNQLLDRIRMKPTRTISGVATVTVLTKPFPCPGHCIFCPNDVRMPKSYLADEPGAQRAERNGFDPYLQTYNRLQALKNIGHNTEKVELIVLGGTWSFYPTEYQIWFIKQCFAAMNDFGVRDRREQIEVQNIFEEADKVPRVTKNGREMSYNEIIDHVQNDKGEELIGENERASWKELEDEHRLNEKAHSRCVGLVIETRPDYIDQEEVIKIRRLGATKVQIGIQSLNDMVLMSNMRGHGAKETRDAIKLLRQGGFKVHAHWMPNLYGSDVEEDIKDYGRLWEAGVCPDELKVYPTSIIENTQLYELYKKGKYKPYTFEQLLRVLTEIMPMTPRYCRLTRVVRDIPSTDIVAGNKLTNFREIAERKLEESGKRCNCIRCREVKGRKVDEDELEIERIDYATSGGKELFISYRTAKDDKICGFLRLSLPDRDQAGKHFIEELRESAIIREIHVYGQVVGIGKRGAGRSQHLGLGTRLIRLAAEVSAKEGYSNLAVISAIGTREYYRKKGFVENELYMHMKI